MGLKVNFEAEIPPSVGPDGEWHDYDLKNVEHLRRAMLEKIQNNTIKFGSVDNFQKHFQQELDEKFETTEKAVQTYYMRKIQMDFLLDWIKENQVVKDPTLDG